MGKLRSSGRFAKDVINRFKGEAHRTDAHGSSIAPTVVGRRIFFRKPISETGPIAYVRKAPTEVQDGFLVIAVRQDGLGHSDGENGVVSELTRRLKKRKFLGLDLLKFIHRPYDVSCNSADHYLLLASP